MKKIIFMLLLATGISLCGWAKNGGPIKKANHTKAVHKNNPQKIYRTNLTCVSYSTSGFCCDVNGWACGDNLLDVAIYIEHFLYSYCPSCSCV